MGIVIVTGSLDATGEWIAAGVLVATGEWVAAGVLVATGEWVAGALVATETCVGAGVRAVPGADEELVERAGAAVLAGAGECAGVALGLGLGHGH